MKLITLGFGAVLAFLGFKAAQDFFSKNIILIADKEDIINEESQPIDNSMDLRGTPTHVCVCGSQVWNIKAVFSDFEIAQYFIDMECASCGSYATAPTPIDREITE
jgi:hypothetical protein